MKAAVLHKPLNLKVENVPEPKVGIGEAIIEVKSIGICGTDVLVYKGLHKNTLFPIIQGHEFTGIIKELSGETYGFKPGDRVSSKGSWGCGACQLGITANGCMAEFVKVPTDIIFRLPDNVSFEEGQSLIGVSCAIHLTERFNVKIGMNAVIIGSGHAGLIIMQVLKHLGIDRMVMIGGKRKKRLNIAAKLGADLCLLSGDPELSEKIKNFLPKGPDIVVESSGSGEALNLAVQLVKAGGAVFAFSIYGDPVNKFQAEELYYKEISIIGVRGAGNCYEDAARLLEKKVVKIMPMITNTFSLEDTNKAFKTVVERAANSLRVIINP